jgi:hypothetical protein
MFVVRCLVVTTVLGLVGCGGSDPAAVDAGDGDPGDAAGAADGGGDVCAGVVCHPDATCTTVGADPTCTCRDGFTGDGVTSCVADCAQLCDLQIEPGQGSVSLAALAPGDTACVLGGADGARGPLVLTDAAGADGAPIVITNCGAGVRLASASESPALAVTGHHFRITGSGTETVAYGLELAAPLAAQALSLGKVHHLEVDRVEVSASEFAGFMIKRDPGATACQVDDRRFDPFVMQGVALHHNYIHDVVGEGIYLGNSFYNGATFSYCSANAGCDWSACDADYPVRAQYPHPVRGVRIYANRIAGTGYDAIQVGAADDDCEIYDNVVEDFGTANIGSQNHGIQVGAGSSCRVYRNRLARGPHGLHLSGVGGTWAYNNLIVDVPGVGLVPNPAVPCGLAGQNPCDALIRPYAPASATTNFKGGMYLFNNTVVSAGTAARSMRRSGNEHFPEEQAENNLFVIDRDDPIERPEGWTLVANVAARDAAAAGLVDAAGGDYRLVAASPATDAGEDLSGRGIVDDLDAVARPQGAGFDCGAYESH